MGDVYLARDNRLGRKVALKVVRLSGRGSADEIQRFLFEARTTAKFNHPHIVTVYAAGVHEGHPYLALEYLDGNNLRQRMESASPSVKESMRILRAVADALTEAHAHGVLHRDLKPENVLLPRDGRVRVVDFGLAKILPESLDLSTPKVDQGTVDQSLLPTEDNLQSKPFGLRGTPSYMAPEQWMGKEVTEASDVWALGVILFELIVGHRPFEAPTPLQLAALVANNDAAPTLDEGLGVPEGLSALAARCLAKRPADRPDAGEVSDKFQELLSGGRSRVKDPSNPFRGLQAFSEKHADYFHGREAEIDAFLERARETPVLPVVGPSGAGKSSFVQAGVIPRVREQGPWMVVQMRPGSDPFGALASRLDSMITVAGEDSLSLLPTLELGPDGDPSLVEREQVSLKDIHSESVQELPLDQQLRESRMFLSLLLDRLAIRLKSKVLLFVDQLEELYTMVSDPADQRLFMEAICSAADDPLGPARVIFTVREDFLSRVTGGLTVRNALSHVTVMRAPEPEAMEEILVRPVEALGYEFEDQAMVQEMLIEAGQDQASLPLLQFAARQLWERRDRKRKVLPRKAHEAMGGVAGALAAHAEGVLKGLSPEDEEVVRDIMLRLVTPEGTRRVLSWVAVLDGLPPGAEEVLGRVIQARLISVRKSQDSGDTELELAHESLVHTWAKLARWLERSREDLSFLYDVGQAVEVWEKRGCREDEVWQGDALTEAALALQRCKEKIPEPVARFLNAGKQKQARSALRRRIGWGLVALAVVVVMFVLVHQKEQADKQRIAAQEGRAAALREGARAAVVRGDLLEARAKLRGSMELQDSPLLRALWWRLSKDPLVWKRDFGATVYGVAMSPDGKTAAVACQDKSVYLIDLRTRGVRILRGHKDQVFSVAFSPNGRLLASGTWSGDVMVRDLVAGTLRPLRGHTNAVYFLSFSPDSRLLATGSKDHTIRVWNMTRGGDPRVLRGHSKGVNGVVFCPSGRCLASGSADKTVRVWDLATGKARILKGHDGSVTGLAASPDGKLLASASYDRTVRVWNLSTGKVERVLAGYSNPVHDVAFDPTGRWLASACYDQTVRIWDLRTGRLHKVLEGHGAAVWNLVFSPDGRFILASARQRGLHLWRVASHSEPRIRRGHQGPVYGIAFSPDNRYLASSGKDHKLRIWEVDSGVQKSSLTGHSARLTSVAYHPDGEVVATSSYDRTIRLWKMAFGAHSSVLGGSIAGIYSVRFSPDGKSLASGDHNMKVRVWDVEARTPRWTKRLHRHVISDLVYSPDGKRLYSASHDRDIKVWDPATGEVLHTMSGHTAPVWGIDVSPDGKHLLSGSADGTVRMWDLSTGKNEVLEKKAGRAYGVAFHPTGKIVGVARSDSTASLIDLRTRAARIRSLRGHRSEVNSLRFSKNGKFVATSSDDGTVRLWSSSTGHPHWRAPVLLMNPPRIFTHLGWIRLDKSLDRERAATRRWRKSVETKASIASQSSDGKVLCVGTHAGRVEMWDMKGDRRLFDEPAGSLRKVLALPDGCVVSTGAEARVYLNRGMSRTLAARPTAVALDGQRILVATGEQVKVLSHAGKERAAYETGVGVTAMTRAGSWLVVGFEDGNIELVPTTPGVKKPSFSFEATSSSPVVRLLPGPPGTIVAGFASGLVGIWYLDSGTKLDHSKLHGPVVHLLLERGKLYIATELGDHLTMDLSTFYKDYCKLVRQVWRDVPVVWKKGLPKRKDPDSGHACFKGMTRQSR